MQDGDTIYINGNSVRLWGIDAEELYEPHGLPAKYLLIHIINREDVTCTPTGDLSHQRIIARCSTTKHADIAQAAVRAGAVLDCRRYSHGEYRTYEPANARLILTQKSYC